jgi:hypothetical protein
MTSDHQIDQLIRRLSPRIDGSPADDPHNPTAAALRSVITVQTRNIPAIQRRHTRRLVLIGGPVAVGVAATVAAVALPRSVPTGPAPAEAHALEITTDGDLIVAHVSDPAADPERYAAEFARYGLDVDLRLVPVSPTVVGTVTYFDSNVDNAGTDQRTVDVVDAPGQCDTPGAGACPVGIRIPEDYGNHVEVFFGRAAEPGETYDATNAATAPGEALAGLDLTGTRVSEVHRILADHGQRATQFRSFSPDSPETLTPSADEVPGDWYVHAVALYAPGEVLLFVGESPEPARPQAPAVPPTAPAPGSPEAINLGQP